LSERRLGLIFLATALALLALMAAQVRRPDGRSALQHYAALAVSPVTGSVLATARLIESGWTGYVDLRNAREERDELSRAVERLEAEVSRARELELENRRLRELLDMRSHDGFGEALSAEIVADLSGGPLRHALMVDRGTRDGVGAGWVALHRGAVVGRILDAGPNSSRLLLVVDPDSGVAVRHQEGRFAGILRGGNRGPQRMANLAYVPRDRSVAVGDVIVTSGLDGLYPPGLYVGRVRDLRGDSPLTWRIRVEVEVDPASLEEVLLLPPLATPVDEGAP
jgi:rod shape-determining protein MreC